MLRAVEGKRAFHAHLRGRKRRDDPLVVLRGEFVLRHAGKFGWQALAARHFVPAGGGVPLSDLPDDVQEDVRAGMGFDDEVTLEKWLESVQS